MPPAIGAAVAAIGITGIAAAITTSVLSVGLSFGLSLATKSLFGKESSSSGFSSEQRNRSQVVRSSIEPRRWIYGESITSGPLVAAFVTGERKEYVHLVIPVAGHEVEEIGEVFFDDQPSTKTKFEDFVNIRKHLGSPDQTVDANLLQDVKKWTEAHRLRGIAYIYVRLKWDPAQRAWPTGIPNIKCVVKGRKVFDPRDPTQVEVDASTYKWTRNAQLCIRDWMRSPAGVSARADEFSTNHVIAEANICDEDIQIGEEETQKRYTCDGVIFLDESRYSVLDQLLTCCAGTTTWMQGKYRIYSGAYRPPLVAINDNDLRAMPKVRPHLSRSEIFNVVRGTFIDPDRSWVSNDFVPVRNDFYVQLDGGEEIVREFEFPFTTDNIRAQRLAKIKLERTRSGTVQFPGKFSIYETAVNEPVSVSIGIFGWNDKVMLPTSLTLNGGQDGRGVDLELQFERPEIYEWNMGEARVLDFADDVDLSSPFDVEPPAAPQITETLVETRNGVKSKVIVTTAGSVDEYVRQYQFEYRAEGAAEWLVLPLVEARRAELLDLANGVYAFRVQAINGLGSKSEYADTLEEIFGLTAPPNPLTGLRVSSSGGVALFSWDLHSDADVRKGGSIEFRHSNLLVGATLENSLGIGRSIPGIATNTALPLKRGTYFAIALDSSDVPSETAASVTTTAATALAFADVDSISEGPAFAGTKSNLVVDAGSLKLTSTGLIDDVLLWDDIEMIDNLGGLNTAGSYLFGSGLDLGVVKTVRLETNIGLAVAIVGDLIDDRIDPIDSWISFDGVTGVRAEAVIEVRLTDEDPNVAPVWSDWAELTVGDFSARAFQFRMTVMTESQDYNVLIDTLEVSAKEAA